MYLLNNENKAGHKNPAGEKTEMSCYIPTNPYFSFSFAGSPEMCLSFFFFACLLILSTAGPPSLESAENKREFTLREAPLSFYSHILKQHSEALLTGNERHQRVKKKAIFKIFFYCADDQIW